MIKGRASVTKNRGPQPRAYPSERMAIRCLKTKEEETKGMKAQE